MAASCPYCNTMIQQGDEAINTCPDCGTQHHGDCWQENQGCTVYGCTAAPPDEPKLTVQASDFTMPPAAPPPPPLEWAAAVAPPPPPPPPPNRPEVFSFTFGGYAYPAAAAAPLTPDRVAIQVRAKSRTAYILLGVFLGAFGAHNFYAGYTYRAVAQLAITICTLFFGAIVSWIWAVVDVCVVDRDSRNIFMN